MDKKVAIDLRAMVLDQYKELVKISLEIHKLQGRVSNLIETMDSLIAEDQNG